jgi:hypothetical protein
MLGCAAVGSRLVIARDVLTTISVPSGETDGQSCIAAVLVLMSAPSRRCAAGVALGT